MTKGQHVEKQILYFAQQIAEVRNTLSRPKWSVSYNQNSHVLTLVAGCWECTAAASQGNLGEEGNATQGNLAATPHALEDNLAHMGSTFPSTLSRAKKHGHASSGVFQGNSPNTHSPKVAGVICRAKGKQAQRVGLWDANPSSPLKQKFCKSSQEGGGLEAELHMFTRVSAQFCWWHALLTEGTDNDIASIEGLKNEVQALKNRCDALKNTVKNLQSICDTHQRSPETLWQQIVNLYKHQGTLDLSYQGEVFEVMS